MTTPTPKLETVLDHIYLSGLQAQVQQIVIDKRNRPRVSEAFMARDALIQILTTQAEDSRVEIPIEIRGGVVRDDRLWELLGLVDFRVNAYTVAVLPLPPGVQNVWLRRAQVEAQSSPDLWVAVVLQPQARAIRAEVAGWAWTDQLRLSAPRPDGRRSVQVAALRPPETLWAALSQPRERVRPLTITPQANLIQALRLQLQPDAAASTQPQNAAVSPIPLQPLSQLDPEVFDCLVADRELAELYVAALDRSRAVRVRIAAPAAWRWERPRTNVAEWLSAAARAIEASTAFWTQRYFTSPAPAVSFGPQAIFNRVAVVDGTDPRREIIWLTPAEMNLQDSVLSFMVSFESPVESASLLVFDAQSTQQLQRLSQRDLEAAQLLQDILATDHKAAMDYITTHVPVYPVAVESKNALRVSIPLPSDTLPEQVEDIVLVLVLTPAVA